MNAKKIVLEIADGSMSVSRIKRISQSVYGIEIDPKLIEQITASAGIATPHREPFSDPLKNQYPDKWSVLLEARSFWVRVRRYWGDDSATALKIAIANSTAGRWRSLRKQFDSYINPHIVDRCNLSLNSPETDLPLELETLYSWDLQRELYLKAFEQEFLAHQEPQSGAEFPLPSSEWREANRQKFKQNCLIVFDNQIGSERKLIEFFAKFWADVYRNRGEQYFENLKHSLMGHPDQPLSQKPFYSATERNFRHWLRNLNEFKTKGPWRVVLTTDPSLPLPMVLEGALEKYGWQKVQSTATIGLLRAAYHAQNSN